MIDPKSQRSATYDELAGKAVGIPVPDKPVLKERKNLKIIGKPLQWLDGPSKVDGSARFGIDTELPGQLTALVARSPVFAGKLRSFDPSKALAVPGVVGVYQVPNGVAVVAKGFWQAKKGRDALLIDCDPGVGEATVPTAACPAPNTGHSRRGR